MKEDKGHTKLVAELEELLVWAKEYSFHDFRSEEFDLPKVELRDIFLTMAKRVVDGKYDN